MAKFSGTTRRPLRTNLTAPILPSERNYQMDDKHVGRSARLDMQKALDLSVQSLSRER